MEELLKVPFCIKKHYSEKFPLYIAQFSINLFRFQTIDHLRWLIKVWGMWLSSRIHEAWAQSSALQKFQELKKV